MRAHVAPPPDWPVIRKAILKYQRELRAANAAKLKGKMNHQLTWAVSKLVWRQSRYLFRQRYQRQTISRELYDWCLAQGFGDAALIAKWKRPGYEFLCCPRCATSDLSHFGTTCICRVPSQHLAPDQRTFRCATCGCEGCNTGDRLHRRRSERSTRDSRSDMGDGVSSPDSDPHDRGSPASGTTVAKAPSHEAEASRACPTASPHLRPTRSPSPCQSSPSHPTAPCPADHRTSSAHSSADIASSESDVDQITVAFRD